MAFVYRYLIPNENATVYVGKAGGCDIRSLAARISAHRHDPKFKAARPSGGYVIEYIDNLSKADADILETALIGAWNPMLNSQKKGWARSEYISPSAFRWKQWTEARLFTRGCPYPHDKPLFYSCDRCGKKSMCLPTDYPPSLSYDMRGGSVNTVALRFYCSECYDIVFDAMERITEVRNG